MSDNKIFLLASECENLFQKILEPIEATSLANNLLHRVIIDCHQRFSVWAGFTGAFADEHASLHRRLMLDPDLQTAVVRLLSLIISNLQEGKTLHSVADLTQIDLPRYGF